MAQILNVENHVLKIENLTGRADKENAFSGEKANSFGVFTAPDTWAPDIWATVT